MKGKLFIDENDFENVKITLSDNSSSVTLPVTSSGRFFARLKWDDQYFFKFNKPGFVMKIIEFSTFLPENHSRRIEPYALNVRLFPPFEGVDTVFFSKPVAKVYFDKAINDFTDDRDYALKVVYSIEQMKKSSVKGKTDQTVKKRSKAPVAKNSVNGGKQIKSPLQFDKKQCSKGTPAGAESQSKSSSVENGHNYDLPPIKKHYPQGKNVEEFIVDNKHITRIIIRSHDKQNIFLRVQHPWGGVFYFIDESPLGIFSITGSLFTRYTDLDNLSNVKNSSVTVKNNK